MGKNFRSRRQRRQYKELLRSGGQRRPMHVLRSGRTGSVHAKKLAAR